MTKTKYKADIIFHREWKEQFIRVTKKTGYDGLGRLVLSIFDILDDTFCPEVLGEGYNAGYLRGVLETIMAEVLRDQENYYRRVEELSKNQKKTRGGASNDEEE